MTSSELLSRLTAIVGEAAVLQGEAIPPELTTDEGLLSRTAAPVAVVTPATTEQVAAIASLAREHRVPLTARGAPLACRVVVSPSGEGSSSRLPP